MIKLLEPKDCCGCNACTTICPKHCIAMNEDQEGFLYPSIDQNLCIDCGLCEKVCPVINQKQPQKPLKVYAAKNKNEEIRLKSSSGGIFTLLAEKIVSEGGIVFGAKFNEQWEVLHAHSNTIEGLADFRGSKYVQSKIGNTYKLAKDFLDKGMKVLFSGTPCQIAGLNLFLRKEYKKLLTVDFVCHGVPSPKVFRMYLNEICSESNNEKKITNIQFRDKILGWKKFSFTLTAIKTGAPNHVNSFSHSKSLDEDIFLKGFLKDLYLRPSCHACPSKNFKSGSDITIGDYWGIQNVLPEFDDDKGVSLVMVNSSKGEVAYQSGSIESIETSYQNTLKHNPSVIKSVNIPSGRTFFFLKLTKLTLSKLILIALQGSSYRRNRFLITSAMKTILIHLGVYLLNNKYHKFKP